MKKLLFITSGFMMVFGILKSPFLLGAEGSKHQPKSVTQDMIDDSIIDPTAKPCDNFYQFACGNWLKNTEIPADLPMWDRSFMAIREKNRILLRTILENYSKGKLDQPKNPDAKKLGDFYAACMDEKQIEKTSLPELKKILNQIDRTEIKNFPVLLAQMHLEGSHAFFGFGDQQDFKDSSQVIGVVDQGGLSLPDRDYYLNNDPKTLEIRKLFQHYVETILGLLGESKSAAQAQTKVILELETDLAEHSMSRVDRRNPLNIYHRLDLQGLKKTAPDFNWEVYFQESGLPHLEKINVTVPEFFKALNSLFLSKSSSDIKTYLKWQMIRLAIPALPNRFVNENFKFVSQALSGQKELEARWKRCIKMIDAQMGFALGRSYVEQAYGSESKAITQEVIHDIEKAFETQLHHLTWIDELTRKQALNKLHAIINQVGYPSHWRNYDLLKVQRDSYLQTLMNGEKFNSLYALNKIGKPVDREDWDMSPPSVNAYYDPSMNKMVFPAGILQRPFFDRNAARVSNFGAIGVVMGHELTHGFDDEGRRYDSKGNLVDWWTPEVAQAFEKKTECVAKEYDAFEVFPGLHLNGKLTLGENIADHGGIRLAFAAWKEYSKKHKKPQSHSSKYTDDQMFFLSFAQSWCTKKKEQFARMLVKTDPHSPPEFRVNGTVSQFSEFATAFQCKPGTAMAPVDPCIVW